MSQGPKLVNTIRLQLTNCFFHLLSLVAADGGYQSIHVGRFHRKGFGAFCFNFLTGKSGAPGSIATRSLG